MAQTCSICRHEKRAEIDRALLAGEPYRGIAMRFGASAPSVLRHKAHIPARLAKAAERREERLAGSLLDQLEALQAQTKALLDRSFPKQGRVAAKDARSIAAVVAEVRKNVELMGKFTGELRPDTQINVLVASAEWASLKGKLFAVLDRHPAAREEIVAVIEGAPDA